METELKIDRWRVALFLFLSVTVFFMVNVYLSPPDSASYYSVARSLVIDADVDFQNEYSDLEFPPNMLYLTRENLISNDWPIGSGILWLPLFLIAHFLSLLLYPLLHSPFLTPDGYSDFYTIFLTCGILLYAICALLAGYRTIEKRYGARCAFWSVLLLILGTPFGFYFFYYNFMAHITSFFAVTLFCLIWMNGVGEKRPLKQWILLGLLAGLMIMVRLQNAVVLVVFPVEAFFVLKNRDKEKVHEIWRAHIVGYVCLMGAALAAFLPQMLFWQKIYGNPIQLPKMEEMHWLQPQIFLTLFSDYHGALSWSPLLLLAIPGLLFLYKKDKIVATAFGLILLLQLYVNAANEIWWAGGSFGNRRFVDYSFIFLIAIAASIHHWRRSGIFVVFVALAALWNFLLIGAERVSPQVLTLDHYVAWNSEFFASLGNLTLHPGRLLNGYLGDFGNAPLPVRGALTILLLACSYLIFLLIRREHKKTLLSRLSLPLLLLLIISINIWMGVAVSRTDPLDVDTPEIKAMMAPGSSHDYGVIISRQNRLLWNNYYEAGYYYLVKSQPDKAFHFYEKAKELVPANPLPYRYLGSIYYQKGQLEDARDMLEKALSLNPNYSMAREYLIRVYNALIKQQRYPFKDIKRLAELHIERKDYKRARQLLLYLLDHHPNDSEATQLLERIDKEE